MMTLPTPQKIRSLLLPVSLIVLVAGVLMLLVAQYGSVDYYRAPGTVFKNPLDPQFTTGKPLAESDPARLRIPAIYVDTNFVPLGIEENGEIEIPEGYEEVGWYTHGPTPGELGPAIVLGHVDSYTGPGVFLTLGQLHPGDPIYIERTDGTTATFKVTLLERYDRSDFPTEKVYGDIDHAGLRLITCSGTYNKETEEYNRVLVVYAALVDEEAADYD